MWFLGLTAALAYAPWFAEASNTPKWIVASVLIPVLLMHRTVRMTRGHWIVLGLVCWSTISLSWATSFFDGVNQLWRYVVLAGAFVLGSCVDIRPAIKGFVIGIAVNVGFALVQEAGYLRSVSVAGYAGLLLQKNYLAEAGLLALVASVSVRQRWMWLPCLVAWVLPVSKAALFAGGLIVSANLWKRNRILGALVAALVLSGGAGGVWYWSQQNGFWDRSPGARVALAANTGAAFLDKPWGHGIGSYWSAYPVYHDRVMETGPGAYTLVTRPRTAHSDILTIAFELGFPGLVLFALLGWYLRGHPYSVVLAVFALLGLFAFPLLIPSTAVLAAIVAGRISGDRNPLCRIPDRWRTGVRAGAQNA